MLLREGQRVSITATEVDGTVIATPSTGGCVVWADNQTAHVVDAAQVRVLSDAANISRESDDPAERFA